MSWIKDEEGDLHNLDHVASLIVAEAVKEGETDSTHGVFLVMPWGDTAEVPVFTGNEAECHERRELIAKKLHVVSL